MLTLVIDLDTDLYQVCYAAQQAVDWDGTGIYTVYADLGSAISMLEAKIKGYQKELGAAGSILCLSDPGGCFRSEIYPEYKANRNPSMNRPLLYQPLREYLHREYPVEELPNLEGDDAVGICATEGGGIMVSIDKDMKTVPGILWNPSTGEKTVITPEEADRNHLIQTLTGDRVDNYPGCPGVGPKKVDKILVEGTWGEVVSAYEKADLTEEDALVQARVARILRAGDYNRETGEVNLWTPTSI